MDDAMFAIGIIVFFFLLWAFAGGPSRPISFAGPFITPITNEGETQSAYGPKVTVNKTITLPGAALTATERSSSESNASGASTGSSNSQSSTGSGSSASSVSGIVTLSHIAGDANNPDGYIQISVSPNAGQSVDITNWIVTSSAARESSPIPTGILVMQLGTDNTLQEIILKPGDKAVIATGASPAVSSFEANECSGYLTSNQSEYNSCVTAHVKDANFLAGLWYVYLGRSTPLWHSSGDTVSVLDSDGNLIAETTY